MSEARATARLAVQRKRGIALLTLEAGKAGPSLTAELHSRLAEAAREIDLDEEARVVLLESRGKVFCRDDQGPGAGVSDASTANGVAAIAAIRQPVICCIQGDALDAGLELALACDLRLAAPAARLGLTQLSRGALPRRGGTQRLPRAVGRARATRMILLSEIISAREAHRIGLVHDVVPATRLEATGLKLAIQLARRGPIALRFAKEAMRAAHDLPLAEGLRLEGDLYVLLQTTADRNEGIASFLERRPPKFAGR